MLHRDDIPFEEIERIEAAIKREHPDGDFHLVFPGDMPPGEVPEEVRIAIAQMESKEDESVDLGCCLSCGELIEDYDIDEEGWEIPEGWRCMVDSSDRICGWRCPDCHEKHVGNTTVFDEETGSPQSIGFDSSHDEERWTTTDLEPDTEGWPGVDGLEGDFE